MMINIENNIFKTLKADYPILVSKNFIKETHCKKILQEINTSKKFDDLVMNGRNRINKGSKNFDLFLKSSKYSAFFFSKLNNKKLNLNLLNQFEKNFQNLNLKQFKKWSFSKKNYGLQEGKKLTKFNFKKNTLNLDLDFSLSKKGYTRGVHRDRDTRIVNFLIYLNKVPKNSGGNLEIFSLKKNKKIVRFQSKKNVTKLHTVKSFPGRSIFFLSLPNSYHAVSRLTTNTKRFFIYGSFSLNKIVKWKNFKK